jgi:hypothetical protein
MNIHVLVYAQGAVTKGSTTFEINQKVENTSPAKEEFSRGEGLLAYIDSQMFILPNSRLLPRGNIHSILCIVTYQAHH